MRWLLLVLLTVTSLSAASAAQVINVEFKFTPFVGDRKNDLVTTVPGTARVFLNGVPYAEQEVGENEVPVLFDDREVAEAVWLPVASCGPAVRHGKNSVRIEFEPADPSARYQASFRWASVFDESTETSEGGTTTATNQGEEGVEQKEVTGTAVFSREFQADFAPDLPWHHGPAVTSLDDATRKALADLVAQRVQAFRPDFAGIYAVLEKGSGIDLTELKKARCLDQAYAAGIRLAAPGFDGLDFILTGNPEVVIEAKSGALFFPEDEAALQKIEDEELQMCVGIALGAVYPPRLVVARSAAGSWEVVY